MYRMNSKYLMMASAIFMGIMGVILQFMPNETLHFFNLEQQDVLTISLQLMGALYFGFAVLNWMAKNVLIGGIYAKPLSLANFTHFLIGGLSLAKLVLNGTVANTTLWIITVLYIVFALAFAFVSFTSPKLNEQH